MRPLVALAAASMIALALLAGCSGSSSNDAPPSASSSSGSTTSRASNPTTSPGSSSSAAPAPPPPIYLNGTVPAPGACPIAGQEMPPDALLEILDVPEAAWNRTYTGPTAVNGTVNSGALCVVWVDGDDEALAPGAGPKVPAQAKKAKVGGTVQVDIDFWIKVA